MVGEIDHLPPTKNYPQLDHVFHTNIIAYCHQNRYVRLAIYTHLFTLMSFKRVKNVEMEVLQVHPNLSHPLKYPILQIQ